MKTVMWCGIKEKKHLIQTLNKISMKHQIIITHTVQTVMFNSNIYTQRRLGGWSMYKLQHIRDWDSPNIYLDFCASKVLLLSTGKILVLNINQKKVGYGLWHVAEDIVSVKTQQIWHAWLQVLGDRVPICNN